MTREEAERLLALAREAKLVGPDAPKWVERLAPKREELVEAARFLAENGEGEVAAELAANVWRLWLVLGDIAGGRQLVAAALDVGEARPSRARALALYGGGSLAFRDGDYVRVRSLAAQARDLTRDLDAAAGVSPLHMLAAGTRLAGDYDEAVALYTESLELNRRLGDRRIVGMELHNLGHVELHRGNVDAAERCFAERAEIRNPDDLYDVAMAYLNQAALAFARAERDHAAGLLARTQSTLDAAGIKLDPDDAFEVNWLRDRLG